MDDEKIIELYFSRDEKAISETENKYQNYLRKVSLNILTNFRDVDECLNDTYLTVWKQIPPTKPQNFLSYLSKIIRNISFNRLDYNKAEKRNNEFDVILSELDDCIADKSVDNREISKEINLFLEKNQKINRIIFVKRYFYSDSIEKIANDMSFSQSKVTSILFRTRKKLREHLIKEGVYFG